MGVIRHPTPGERCKGKIRSGIGMVPPEIGNYFASIRPIGCDAGGGNLDDFNICIPARRPLRTIVEGQINIA